MTGRRHPGTTRAPPARCVPGPGDNRGTGWRWRLTLPGDELGIEGAGAPSLEPQGISGDADSGEAFGTWDALHRMERDDDGMPRAAVLGYRRAGRMVVVEGARSVRADWRVRPHRYATRIDDCGRDRVATRLSGRWSWSPARCRCRWCPSCLEAEASRVAARVVPEIMALVEGGCTAVAMTLTQGRRADERHDRPVVLTPEDIDDGWRGHAGVDVGYAVAGSPLAAELDDLLRSWRELRHDGAGADWFRRNVWGVLYRWEVTAEDADGAPGVPRWHAHLHAVLILAPHVKVTAGRPRNGRVNARGRWWSTLRRFWSTACDRRGRSCSSRAQDATLIRGDREAIARAVRYVVKYPFKVARMTVAQRLEAAAVIVGRHVGHRSGGFHEASRVRRAVRERIRRFYCGDAAPPDSGGPVVDRMAVALDEWDRRERRTLVYREATQAERADPSSAVRVERDSQGERRAWVPLRASWAAEAPPGEPIWVGSRTTRGPWIEGSFLPHTIREWALHADSTDGGHFLVDTA